MYRHLGRTVESGSDATGTGAPGGIAMERMMPPLPDELGGGAVAVADEGDAAGQANLSTMSVSA